MSMFWHNAFTACRVAQFARASNVVGMDMGFQTKSWRQPQFLEQFQITLDLLNHRVN